MRGSRRPMRIAAAVLLALAIGGGIAWTAHPRPTAAAVPTKSVARRRPAPYQVLKPEVTTVTMPPRTAPSTVAVPPPPKPPAVPPGAAGPKGPAAPAPPPPKTSPPLPSVLAPLLALLPQ